MFSHIIRIILVAFVSYLGISLSYPQIYSPLEHHGTFQKIGADRWLEDGATISLSDLLHRGNFLELHFKDWHPEGQPQAKIRANVCGELASEFDAVVGGSQKIYLKGDCEPRLVSFEVLNPFSTETDPRKLGVLIDHVKLDSKLKIPLVNPLIVLPVFLLLYLLIFAYEKAFTKLYGKAFAVLLLVSSTYFLANNYFNNFMPLAGLYFSLLALVIGFYAYQKFAETEGFNLSRKAFYLLMFLVFILGLLLRFYSLDFGLPANYHPDEVPKYNAVMRMRQYGDLNPRYFLHPTLLLYSAYFFNEVYRLLTSAAGAWDETFVFAGRIMSATAGSLSVFLTGLIGARLFNRSVGVFSALILAFLPLHVTCSRYLKEDALLVFFILLAVYLTLVAVQKDKKLILLLAGIVAGFSAGVKYSGLVSFCIIFAAPWLFSKSFIPSKKYIPWTVIAILLMPIGFLITTPYSLLDSETFLKDFMHEKSHMTRGHSATISPWSQLWMYHVTRSLWEGSFYLPLVLGLIGFGYCLYSRKISCWYLLALFLLYYVPAEFVNAKPAPQPERYVMPCMPFLAISAAFITLKTFSYLKNPLGKMAVLVLILLLVSFPAYRSLTLASQLKPDTRDILHDWMIENLEPGSKVAVDWKPYSPRFFNNEFEIEYLPRAGIIQALNVDALENSSSDYLILSSLFYDRYFSQPNALALHREHIKNVFRHFKIVKRVKPRFGTYGFNNPELVLLDLIKKNQ